MTLRKILELELVNWTKEDFEKHLDAENFGKIKPLLIARNFDHLVDSEQEDVICEILEFVFYLIRESQNEIQDSFYIRESGPEDLGVEINDNYEIHSGEYGEVGQIEYGLTHNGYMLSWSIELPFNEWSEPVISSIANS